MVREICYERRLHLQTSQYSLNIYALEWGYVKVNGCWFGWSMLCLLFIFFFYFWCMSMLSTCDFSSIFLCLMLHEYPNVVDNLMENLEKYCSASVRLNMPCMIKIYITYIFWDIFKRRSNLLPNRWRRFLYTRSFNARRHQSHGFMKVVKLQFNSDNFNWSFTRPFQRKINMI